MRLVVDVDRDRPHDVEVDPKYQSKLVEAPVGCETPAAAYFSVMSESTPALRSASRSSSASFGAETPAGASETQVQSVAVSTSSSKSGTSEASAPPSRPTATVPSAM